MDFSRDCPLVDKKGGHLVELMVIILAAWLAVVMVYVAVEWMVSCLANDVVAKKDS